MSGDVLMALCSLGGTLMGTFGGIFVSSRLTSYRIEQLEKKVDKHNRLVERMTVLETDQKGVKAWLSEHTKRLDRLEG